MKLFLTLLALFTVSTAKPVSLTHQQELESIADFLATVRKIYDQFVERGSDFVCSAKLQELLDILGLPEKLDGAVELAQQWLCGEPEALMFNPHLHDAALQGFTDEVKRIYALAKAYGKDLICGSSLHDLLDLFGVDDRLDGAVKMVQGWICESSDLVKRSSQIDLILEESFVDTIKRIYNELKGKGKDFVCSAKLNVLLEILGMDDRLAPAVKYVQNKLCSESEGLQSISHLEALEAYAVVWSDVWEKIKSYSHDKLCTTKLQDLLDILGFPDALDGAVEMAQNKICGFFSVQKRNSEVDFILEASFIDTVKRIYNQLKEYGTDFVCGAKIQELMDILGVDNRLDSAVAYVQNKLCGESDALVKRDVHSAALQAYGSVFGDIWDTLKSWSHDKLCTTKLQDLLDILGFPEALDGAVEMAQSAICGIFSVQKRDIEITPVMYQQAVGAFKDTVKDIYERLRPYLKAFVCSSGLQTLMDILGVPDDFDGAVEIAQEMICGRAALSSALMVKHNAALQGFIDTIMDVLEQFYTLGQSKVCNAGIPELLASLSLPETMVWAVEIAVNWFCV